MPGGRPEVAPDPEVIRRRGEEGYNLVILLMLVTVANLLLAAGFERWSTVIQREKEVETIFRGMQYAEAVRVFQLRNGRFPNTLDELVEIEPRAIRQLFPNPMNEDGAWGVLLQTSAGAPGSRPGQGRRGGRNPEARRPGQGQSASGDRRSEVPSGPGTRSGEFGQAPSQRRGSSVVAVPPSDERDVFGRRRESRTSGPIIGVYPAVEGDSIRVFLGETNYEKWHFRADIVPQPIILGADKPMPRPNSGVFWRPFPEGLEPQIEQGSGPGGGQGQELGGGRGLGNRGGLGSDRDQSGSRFGDRRGDRPDVGRNDDGDRPRQPRLPSPRPPRRRNN